MKNNFYNIPEDWYKEFNNTFNISNNMDTNMLNNMNYTMFNNMNTNLAEPKEGFLRGNLFNNLYDPYKNYRPGNLKATSAKEELLFNILMHKFALTELNLYLDTNPNDTQMLNLYNKYLVDEKKLCDQYEKNYGPLTVDSENMENTTWKWIKSPWPWEGTK